MHTSYGEVLLPIARASIALKLGQQSNANENAAWLQDIGACFVTLTQKGQLRGCIGTLEAHRSLLSDVKANAQAAAFHDPRFAPLTVNEFKTTDVEVSLLSPMQPLEFDNEKDALSKLQPNIDGIVFEFGRYRSTFLPQVWEQIPEPTEFMAHLKYKAGLQPNFWAEEVKLFRYTVSKWKEDSLKSKTT